MSTARFIVGDVFDVMADMPDGSIDLVLTSPPFLALRSYLPPDHPAKEKEIGAEATPAEFIDTLLALSAEWDRVLAPHGTLAVELGDTYSGGANDSRGTDRPQDEKNDQRKYKRVDEGWPLAKSLALIPELYRVGLVYGINPLTGAESPAGRWRARNVVRWVRPNPPVGVLGDKFRPATSEMVVVCKSDRRWFDLDAVRTEHKSDPTKFTSTDRGNIAAALARGDGRGRFTSENRTQAGNPAVAPPLDWWKISPKGYAGAHYATFPPELCERPIQAMCPREVCTGCGEPRRRIVSVERKVTGPADKHKGSDGAGVSKGGPFAKSGAYESARTEHGWSVCDCSSPTYRPGVVLDPFAGSGTTLAVASGYGRDSVGIDLDERNADMARDRVGIFLTVEEHVPVRDAA